MFLVIAASAALLPHAAFAKIDPKEKICTAYNQLKTGGANPELRAIPEAPSQNNSGIASLVNCTDYQVIDIRDVTRDAFKRVPGAFKKRAGKSSTAYDWSADGMLNFNPDDQHNPFDHWGYKKTQSGDAWPGTCQHSLAFKLRAPDGTIRVFTPPEPFNVCKAFILALVRIG